MFRVWVRERRDHVAERDAIIAAYERRQVALEASHAAELRRKEEAHAREVQTWRRRLRDCEHAKDLDKRWYDKDVNPDPEADPAGGNDG